MKETDAVYVLVRDDVRCVCERMLTRGRVLGLDDGRLFRQCDACGTGVVFKTVGKDLEPTGEYISPD